MSDNDPPHFMQRKWKQSFDVKQFLGNWTVLDNRVSSEASCYNFLQKKGEEQWIG